MYLLCAVETGHLWTNHWLPESSQKRREVLEWILKAYTWTDEEISALRVHSITQTESQKANKLFSTVYCSVGLLEPPGHPSLWENGPAEGARGPGLVTVEATSLGSIPVPGLQTGSITTDCSLFYSVSPWKVCEAFSILQAPLLLLWTSPRSVEGPLSKWDPVYKLLMFKILEVTSKKTVVFKDIMINRNCSCDGEAGEWFFILFQISYFSLYVSTQRGKSLSPDKLQSLIPHNLPQPQDKKLGFVWIKMTDQD